MVGQIMSHRRTLGKLGGRLASRVGRRLESQTEIEALVWRGIPEHPRSRNGPQFVAQDLRKWLGGSGMRSLHIEL